MKPSPPASSTGFYFPHLDSIRGIAISMVVIFHAFSFEPAPGHTRQAIIVKLLQAFSFGVPLFFVLSGFLISLIVIRDPAKFSARSYALRRWARVAPAFWLSILFYAFILARRGLASSTPLLDIIGNMLTLPNFMASVPMINPVSWSLFVEMHFYIVLPLAYFLWRRVLPKKAELATLLTLAVAAIVFRALSWTFPTNNPVERFFLLNRFPNAMDYFAWGFAFAWLFREHRAALMASKAPRWIALCGVFLLPVFLFYFTALLVVTGSETHLSRWWIHETCRLLMCVLAALTLFIAALPAGTRAPWIFSARWLVYTGVISYEWFLFHPAIIPWVRYHVASFLGISFQLLDARGETSTGFIIGFAVTSLFGVAVSYAVAAAVHRWISMPILRHFRGK